MKEKSVKSNGKDSRESFNSRWGFILACIGSAVGMGNIWMFSTRVSLYGGGSFLIPYFIFVILIGSTGVIGEMSLGRAARSGPIDAFGMICEQKGKRKIGEALGMIPVLGSLAMAIGYTVVMGWILKYAVGTFTGATLAPESIEDFGGRFGSMASAFGNNLWQIGALIICMAILMFGVGRGVPINDHKFVALHAAVWSGGSFVYVPENVKLDIPLQSYFRLNSPESGQFEHTLIIVEKGAKLHFIEGCSAPKYNKVNLHAGCVELYVKDDAYLRYSTIENWSKNMMNLNTKKALVGKNAQVDWVTGSFGSKVSMLYPMSILNGEGAKTEYTGITFAGGGQNLDTGFKVIHNAKNTSSVINSKSISKDGGACTYRSLVRINPQAQNSKCSVSCESLMLDDISRSDTIPVNDIRTDEVEFSHEAKIGKISDKEIFYLMTRGLSEEDAKAMIVRGFASPISKELPVEYAVEMNNLINLELEGAIG